MKRGRTHLRLARIVLEAETPLSITTGVSSDTFDTALVRDANGLPAIPGSSLRGALRSLYTQQHGEKAAEKLFGFVRGDTGEASDLEVGWGRILDGKGEPVDGLLDDQQSQDRLLQRYLTDMAARPPTRDGVRLNAWGVVDGRGKYDRAVLPKGARFSVDLAFGCKGTENADKGKEKDTTPFDDLLRIVATGFPLGGGTGRGLGRMVLAPGHPIRIRTFDLCTHEDRATMAALHADPGAVNPMEEWVDSSTESIRRGDVLAEITLRPDDIWRMGRGAEPLPGAAGNQKPPDLLPYTEPVIVWTDPETEEGTNGDRLCRQTGALDDDTPRLLLAGSGVKGALRHRTVFHYRRLTGQVIDPGTDKATPSSIDDEPVARILFGAAREKKGGEPATAGLFSIDDVLFTPEDHNQTPLRITRNSLDRFTGGTIDHALYDEQVLVSKADAPDFRLRLRWRPLREAARDALDQEVTKRNRPPDAAFKDMLLAFRCALDDLCAGRLALGAGGGRGAGTFAGHHTFDTDTVVKTVWIEASASQPEPAEAGS